MPDSWMKKKSSRLLFALLINALILILYLTLFSPVYEVNDDSALCNLVNGSLGIYDPHVIFQNYMLGILYTRLYQITAAVSWYALVQYFFMFVALTVLTCTLMDYLEHNAFLGLVAAVLLVFGYELYVRPQFSKTAAVLVVAGAATIFSSLTRETILKRKLVFGSLLVLVGAWYRMSVFKCAMLIFSAAGIWFLLNLKDFPREKAGTRLRFGLVTGILLLLVILGFDKFDQMQYRSESWKYYKEFNAQRIKLSDYGYPSFEGHEKEYQAIGFDLSAIKLLRRWTFQDAEKYDKDSLRKIVELKEEVSGSQKIDKAYIKKFIKDWIKGLVKLPVFWLFVITGLICLVWGKLSLRTWIAVIYEGLIITVVYGYTFYKGRFLMHRIDIGIWLEALVVLLLIYRPQKKMKIKAVCTGLAVLALACSMYLHWGLMRINRPQTARIREANRKIIETIHADPDHLYLKTIGSVSFYKAYGVFDPTPVGMGDNQYPLGGWVAQTEPARTVLDRYSVSNPLCFRDMIDNDEVRLIDKNIDMMVDYLRVWYAEDARAEKVDKIGKWDVYRIVTEKGKGTE